MYSLTNVPTAKGEGRIQGQVDGEMILILNTDERGSIRMTDTYIGEHMMEKPEALRDMYARDLATAIRMGRDAGYAQAFAELRHLIGSV